MLAQDRIDIKTYRLETAGEEPETPFGDAEIWRGWVQRGNRRAQAGGHQRKMLLGIAVIALVLGSAFYLLLGR